MAGASIKGKRHEKPELLNPIDRVVMYLSPAAGLRRMHARVLANRYIATGYEAASLGGRLGSWGFHNKGPNTEYVYALPYLRERSRDLIRNNPWAKKAVNVIVSNTVGTGIAVRPKVTGNSNAEKILKAAWENWAGAGKTNCDYTGRHTMSGLQRLAMRTLVASGECIVVKRLLSSKEAKKIGVPLQIQILEPDYIDTHREAFAKGENRIIQGIEYDSAGRRVAYWLFPEHPGETGLNRVRLGLISARVPAEEILHIFREDRAGQVRGVPWGHAVLIRLKDLDEYEDATLMRNKVAACFAGFIQDNNAAELAQGLKAQAQSESSMHSGQEIEPGTMEILPPGRSITFNSPPGAPGHTEFTVEMKQSIAAGYDITYEMLTGDYSRVTFVSGRMGEKDVVPNILDWQWNIFIPQFAQGVFGWFRDAMVISAGSVFQTADADYTAPRRAQVDPLSETKADIANIRGGLKARSEVIRERGDDPEEVAQGIADDNAQADELGLVLDSDPRKTSAQGQIQMDSGSEDDSEPDEKIPANKKVAGKKNQ